jgi:hypothetical protein
MTKIAILDADEHRRLRVRTGYGAQYGENVAIVPVLATELRKLAVEYPVFFAKSPETGRFGLVALLGLSAGNNQYLDGDHWLGTYVPLHFRRQPFLVAQEGQTPAKARSLSTSIIRASAIAKASAFLTMLANRPNLPRMRDSWYRS